MPLALENTRWKQRAFAPDRQRRRDPRLQDRVAFDDPPATGVEARPVERMRHLADEPAHRVARQPRVGVERDDVAHIGGHGGRRPSTVRNVVSVAPRSSRLSSCSLPRLRSQPIQRPSPSFHTRRRCKQQEAVAARRRSVTSVQPRDALVSQRPAAPRRPATCSLAASRQSESSAK